MKNNPWGLPRREAEVMSGLTEFGLSKSVALDLGISHKTVSTYLKRSKDRMSARTIMHAVLMWDRWARAQ